MASKSAKLKALGTIPLFSDCSKRELDHIMKASREITVEPGASIVEQGQMGTEAFVILDGDITVRRGGRKIADLGSGDIVGEMSLLDHGPRTATAVAESPASLLALEQNDFRKVLNNHPSIAVKLLATMAERIRHFDRKYYG
jgi:CRP-like cAMP-binding protein